jgi:hypothetical protein
MKWPTWHIIGNSDSISEEDFSGLKNTIGVNRILRHASFTPEYLLLVDLTVLREEQKRISGYTGKIIRYVGLGNTRNGPRLCRGEAFDIEDGYFPIRRFDGLYAKSQNTGVYAIEYAARRLYPGRGQIVLHGMDFTAKGRRKTHFYGKGSRDCSSQSWPSVVRKLGESARFLWANKIRVLNGSPWHGPLDAVIPRVKK